MITPVCPRIRSRACACAGRSSMALVATSLRPLPPAPTCRGSSRSNQILHSIEGPVAKIIAVIIIIVTGLSLAFGDTVRRLPPADPDRLRPVDRVRGVELLPVVLLLRRRSADLMRDRRHEPSGLRGAGPSRADRADPARRRAALRRHPQRHARRRARAWGCGSGSPGSLLWALGHMAAVWAAKRDPHFVEVVRRHLRYPAISASEGYANDEPRRISPEAAPR